MHELREQQRERQERGKQDRHPHQHEQLVEGLAAPHRAFHLRREDPGGVHQYTSRKWRVRKKPAMLNSSVVTISTRPAANMD